MTTTNLNEQFESTTARFYNQKRTKLKLTLYLCVILSLGVTYIVYDVGIHTATAKVETEKNEVPQTNDDIDDIEGVDLGVFLSLFSDRSSAIAIYAFMIVLLGVFNFQVFRRVGYMLRSYDDREEIELSILNGENKTGAFEDLLKETEKGFPKQYLSALYKSFTIENSKAFFDQLYHDYIKREETHLFNFQESVNKSMIWIIRLGIFGTLVGLAVAFYDLFDAIGSIDVKSKQIEIKANFPLEVQDALLGNVIAVGTSLTAHLITLVVELLVVTLLRKEENVGWMHKVYEQLINDETFSSEPVHVKDHLGSINKSTRVLESNVQRLSKAMSDFYPKLGLANKSFGDITEQSKELSDEFSQINSSLNGLSSGFKDMNNRIPDSVKELSSLNTAIEAVNHHLLTMDKQSISIVDDLRELDPVLVSLYEISKKVVETLASADADIDKLPQRLNTSNDELSRFVQNTKEYNELYTSLLSNSESLGNSMSAVSNSFVSVEEKTKSLEEQLGSTANALKGSGKATFTALQKYVNALKTFFDKLNSSE